MFIHAVLFEIKPGEVHDYRSDSRMWAREARKNSGFIAYFTMQRAAHENQYVSVYEWKSERAHKRFMGEFHELLVAKSKAKVKVLGYYNLKRIDEVR